MTWPALGFRSPLIVLRTVDFPAPLGPIRQTLSPVSTARSTPFRISPAPYPAVTPERVRMVASPSRWSSGRSFVLDVPGSIQFTSVAEIGVQHGRVDLDIARSAHGDPRPAIKDDH